MMTRTTIGRYRVVGMLGEGGMGVVYAAHDDRLGRPVAIKTLRVSGDPEARARLWREARAAASVSHPNVCPLYEVGEDGDELFLAMEMLEGESLAVRLQRGPLPLAEAVSTTLEILGALEALHRRDIVHRDLKPSNVFLTPHGLKLLDFGLARAANTPIGEDALTQPGIIMGTPRYMAPEQWRGEPVDARTDVFAVGTLLFEMLTGRQAFGGNTAIEAYHAVVHEQPPALVGTGAVAAMDRVIRRALEKRPGDRFASAEAMANAVREAMAQTDPNVMGPATGRVRTLIRLIVLPFRMLRPDPEIEFLAFSLPDAVTASLSGLGSLVVRSSHAAARFAGESVDFRSIGTAAEVDAVLLGTLMRAGDQVRVNAQLVETPAGTIIWSRTAQVAMADLFQMQDDLTRAIVESLAVPLSAGEQSQLRRDVPASARAYEFYLRANQLGQNADLSAIQVARDLYRSALDEDPDYAPGWVRYARACRLLAKYGDLDKGSENLRLAEAAFQKAFELNPDLPLAHSLYTHFEVERGHSLRALERLLERARLHPADPDLFTGLCAATRYCGLMDASLAADRHARHLDPAARTSVMYTHFMLGEWDKAVEADHEAAKFITAYSLPMLGREREALETYRAALAGPAPFVVHVVARGMIAALERDPETCRAAFEPIASSRHRFDDPEGLYFVARALVRAGDPERGLALLEGVVEKGFTCPAPFMRDPWLDALRSERRFREVVDRAEAGRRAAAVVYLEREGDRLLGVGV